MSSLKVSSLAGRVSGDAPTLTDGAVLPVGVALTGGGGINVTGIITGSSYRGDGSQLTGIDASSLKSGGSVKVQANSTGAVVTGVLTATTGSFSGNVSVGGVLTYQDVTNVDSIGIVTARSGLVVVGGGASITDGGVGINTNAPGAGLNVAGVITATQLDVNGTINQNGAELSAAPTVSGICTGTVAAHKALMVNSSGQFKTPTGQTASIGNASDFRSSNKSSSDTQMLYMSDLDKYVLVYCDNDDNNKVYARVATRSGTSFSYGTEVLIYNNGSDWISADYLGGGKVILVCNPNGRISLLTVSGTSISEESGAGTTNTYFSTFVIRAKSSTKALLVYRYTYSGNLRARVITISGNTFSIGNDVEIYGSTPTESNLDCCYNPVRDKFFVVWRHGSNDNMYARSVTIASGHSNPTAPGVQNGTKGLEEGTMNNSRWYPKCIYDKTSGNIVLTVTGGSSNDGYIYAIAQSAASSGNDITYASGTGNSGVQWQGSSGNVDSLNYGFSVDGQGNIYIGWQNTDQNKYLYGLHATISGGTITRVTALNGEQLDGTVSMTDGAYGLVTVARGSRDTTSENIIFPVTYAKATGGSKSSRIRVKLLAGTDLTASNLIGFSDASGGSSGDTIKVKVVGNTTTQSSLTPGQIYYVQNDGTLSTTADDPSVVAGRAISSTELLIQPA